MGVCVLRESKPNVKSCRGLSQPGDLYDILLPQGPAIALLSIYPQDDYPSFHRRHLFNHVHCCSIYKSQKLETIEVVINRKMGKKNVVYLYNGILLNHFKSEITKSVDKWKKIPTEVSQIQKDEYNMYLLICGYQL